jgi:DNA-binding MarR family transcriptional regulator
MQARLGVTGPQRLAMRIVGMAPGLSAGALARTLHLHPSTLTGILRRLEQRGLIRRSPHPADARRTVLHLTADGRAQDAFRAGTLEHAVVMALDRVSATDVASTRRVLQELSAALAAQDGH